MSLPRQVEKILRTLTELPVDDFGPAERVDTARTFDYDGDTKTSEPGAVGAAPALGQHLVGGAVMAQRNALPSARRKHGSAQATLRVLLTVETDWCVEWTGSLDEKGYGRLSWEGRTRRPHAIAAEVHIGPRPEGLEVAHSCANRCCLNYRHLRYATHQENMDDRALHGTTARGERAGGAILTEGDVLEIRRLYAEGQTGPQLAELFSVSTTTVGAVVTGVTWGWLEPESIPGGVWRNGYVGQTHCKHGHEFTPENTNLRGNTRHCRACAKRRNAEWLARKAAKS